MTGISFDFALRVIGIGIATATATPVGAANPLIGTWTLDLQHSHFPEAPPKYYRETYRARSPDKIEIVVSTAEAAGPSTVRTFVFPTVGGVAVERSDVPPAGETFIETALSSREWVMTYMMNGREAGTIVKHISADGRTMREIERYVDEKGKWVEGDHLLRRQ